MQSINLQAYNNQDFKLTLDMSAWIAAGYDMGVGSHIRMQASTSAGANPVLLWSNQPSEIVGSTGAITLSGNDLIFTMPATTLASQVTQADALSYDTRLVTASGQVRVMFGGTLGFILGVNPVD